MVLHNAQALVFRQSQVSPHFVGSGGLWRTWNATDLGGSMHKCVKTESSQRAACSACGLSILLHHRCSSADLI